MKRLFAVLLTGLLIAAAGFAAESEKSISKKEMKGLIETASTPAEHNRLAQHYRMQADRLDADANEHTEMAKVYRTRSTAADTKRPMSPDTAAHCDYFSESLHKAAGEARALATAHAEMAKN